MENKKEKEVQRISRCFRVLLKKIAKDYYLKELWFGSEEFYKLQENEIKNKLSFSFIYLKTKHIDSDKINVSLKVSVLTLNEEISLPPLILKGGFSLKKPISGKHLDEYFVSDYWVKI